MRYIKFILSLLFGFTTSFSGAQCPPGTAPVGPNLVVNSDFSQGNTGFTSGYVPGTGGFFGLVSIEGQFAIVTDPSMAHNNFASFGDHTSGSGLMFVVNGASTPNVNVWCQTVAVQPFTTYTFSMWVASTIDINPAILQFSINGVNLGIPFTAPSVTGLWQQFSINWYSGSQLSANICILNQNTFTTGNDFAIDDIEFTQCECLVPPVAGPDTTICYGETVQLYASGGHTYQWFPSSGLSNAAIPNPVATVSANSLYYVVVLSQFCIDTVSVSIAVTPLPQLDAGIDDTICAGASVQLNGSGTGSFSWSPTAGLSNPNIKDPIATPTSTTTYVLTVENSGCTSTDSVTIFVKPRPTINAGPDISICPGESVSIINASGTGIISWTPTIGLSNPAVINPIAFPLQTTNYILTVDSGGCQSMDTMTVTIKPVPQASAGADKIICAGDSIQINGSGTGNVSWTPATGLNDPGIINPVASPAQTTTYYLSIIANGCENIDSMTVTVKPLPQTDAGADVSVCEGDSIQLSGSGSGIVTWSPSSGINNPGILNPIVSPSQTTVYVLNVDSGGCKNVDSLVVTVITLPQVFAGADDTICAGSQLQLQGQGTGIVSWSPSAGLNNTSILNPVASPSQTTNYILTILANGCENQDTLTIMVKPLPQVHAGADVSICAGDSVQLTGSGWGTVSWFPSTGLSNHLVTNPVASPSLTTVYILTVDSGGCENTDTMSVTVKALPLIDAGGDKTICKGSSVQLFATGATQYQWTPSHGLSNSFILDPVADPLTTTTYFLTGSKNGCVAHDTITVYVNDLPVVDAGNDTVINYKTDYVLSGMPAHGNWSSKNGLLCTGCSNYNIFVEQDEMYYFSYTDSNGCENADTVIIYVNKTCPEPIFPDAFTPNGDFINDIFKPVFDNINIISEAELIIYNRWGEQVFYTNEIDRGWDGKFVELNQFVDMYIYKFRYSCEGKTNTMNGRLFLLK